MIEKIVMIGSGNVATHMALALYKAGLNITAVFSRNISNAEYLASKVEAKATDRLKDIPNDADLYLVSVKDSAVAAVAKNLELNENIVAHTAGAISQDVLKPASKNYGVFYPLQTFSKNKELNFNEIPLCIEAANRQTEDHLMDLAKKISGRVYSINEEQRQILHVAAVFVSNFTNYMFHLAEDITSHHKIDPEILRPLIRETVHKLQHMSAYHAQTGPAARGDENTMNKHLELLRQFPELKEVYKMMSEAIMKRH
ncbi:MAG: DUF2520 domain-containing protein [Bacteroidales bacterium]|nr:DUF2520 domain-containing protein [Bacteroidales bacterium]